MRTVPERSPILQILAVFGGFLLGPWVALQIGLRLAPESGLVHTVSVFAFVLVFVGGTLLWSGVGIATTVAGRLSRGRRPRSQGTGRIVPPGYRSYVVLGCGAGAAVGLVAGVATSMTVGAAVAVWTVVGAAYGMLLWLAAHQGYLPFQ